MSGNDLKRQHDYLTNERRRLVHRLKGCPSDSPQARELRKGIGAVKRALAELNAEIAEQKQALVNERRKALEALEDPTLAYLDSALHLLRELRSDVVLTVEEEALLDAIAIHIKERTGYTIRGHRV